MSLGSIFELMETNSWTVSLLSAGADSSIAIWDLDLPPNDTQKEAKHTPLGQVNR